MSIAAGYGNAAELQAQVRGLQRQLAEAPERVVVGGQWDDVFAREGNVVWCDDLPPGTRVRLVVVEAPNG